MSKKNFVTLILSTVGGILFAIGMCMCLLPEWNAFAQVRQEAVYKETAEKRRAKSVAKIGTAADIAKKSV